MAFSMSLSLSGETLLAFTLAMVLLALSPGPGFFPFHFALSRNKLSAAYRNLRNSR